MRKTSHDEGGRPQSHGRHWGHFRFLMTMMVAVAALSIVGALFWLRATGTPMNKHVVIATALGVGLTVLLAGVLMSLVFVSARSGADEDVENHIEDDL